MEYIHKRFDSSTAQTLKLSNKLSNKVSNKISNYQKIKVSKYQTLKQSHPILSSPNYQKHNKLYQSILLPSLPINLASYHKWGKSLSKISHELNCIARLKSKRVLGLNWVWWYQSIISNITDKISNIKYQI